MWAVWDSGGCGAGRLDVRRTRPDLGTWGFVPTCRPYRLVILHVCRHILRRTCCTWGRSCGCMVFNISSGAGCGQWSGMWGRAARAARARVHGLTAKTYPVGRVRVWSAACGLAVCRLVMIGCGHTGRT